MNIPSVDFMDGCTYCDLFLRPGAKEKDSEWNKVLLESENFVVVPTIGMIVPGWLLLVSKMHYLNLASIPKSMFGELQELKEKTRRILTACFGKPVFFEHGPGRTGQPAGSCIDHAHLHCVPITLDLYPELNTEFGCSVIGNFSDLPEYFSRFGPYLFYENENGLGYACRATYVESQYFRRLVAAKVGKQDEWDWAVFQGGQNLRLTLKKFDAIRPTELRRGIT